MKWITYNLCILDSFSFSLFHFCCLIIMEDCANMNSGLFLTSEFVGKSWFSGLWFTCWIFIFVWVDSVWHGIWMLPKHDFHYIYYFSYYCFSHLFWSLTSYSWSIHSRGILVIESVDWSLNVIIISLYIIRYDKFKCRQNENFLLYTTKSIIVPFNRWGVTWFKECFPWGI